MAPSALDAMQCPGSWARFVEVKEALVRKCWHCGANLTGRRRHWCSDECGQWWQNNHDWNSARHAAIRRDNSTCVKCGAIGDYTGSQRAEVPLEVNHIEPRNGKGYANGCWNHQENLETLCHNCHVGVTNQQRIGRNST